ncbi:ACT domain-containing protein [Lentisphaerota bacterium ZTH]|nr:ACT domain-containing protein [Lentisphaerota bacterium]WET07114.1 ACT domain-containing protein [Lentisphaerota bacterium ZTH]
MKTIKVITENKPGAVAEITEILADSGVNIETLDADTFVNSSVIMLTVNDWNKAVDALNRAGLQAICDSALVIQVNDEPGALAKIAKRFSDADINIKSIRLLKRENGKSIVAIAMDEPEKASGLLHDVLISV